MAVDFEASLLRSLKLDDPWLSPKPWESIPSESGGIVVSSSSSRPSSPSSFECFYDLSSVSEASLVRLVLNALQGVESAVASIEKHSALFCADLADRSRHRIPTIWNRSLSTLVLGNMLKSIGVTGSLIVLLHKFVDYFSCSSLDATSGLDGEHVSDCEVTEHPRYSLVNQAFAVAVRTVLGGYICALDTLNASVNLRRSSKRDSSATNASHRGSLTSISHCEVTLLEVYAHTKELRSRIEGLGYLCRLCDSAQRFSLVPFDDLISQGVTEIHNFYRGGDLLTYLYRQLQVVDPAHCSLLKFLFLRSLEPYCGFIRSWIYEAKISDPYGEFIVEYAADSPSHRPCKADAVDFQLATIREEDEVVTPCFLNDVLVQLLRAGQQLQVIMKLLRLCNYAHAGEDSFEDILPSPSDFPTHKVSGCPLSFNKRDIEDIVISRREFYSRMHGKLEKFMDTIEINYRQVILHDAQQLSSLDETWILPSDIAESNSNQVLQRMDSDASSGGDDFSYALEPFESSEYSSTDGSDEQDDAVQSSDHDVNMACPTLSISSLVFSTVSSDKDLHETHRGQETSCTQNLSADFSRKSVLRKDDALYKESLQLSKSWLSKVQYAGGLPNLGWPVGGLHQNPLSPQQRFRDNENLIDNVEKYLSITDPHLSEKEIQCSSKHIPVQESFNESKMSSPRSFLLQSWNTVYPNDVLSMNPMVTKNGFLEDVKYTSKISKNFPYFDFSIPSNPSKVFEGKVYADQSNHVENNVLSAADHETSSVARVDSSDVTVNVAGDIKLDKDLLGCSDTLLGLKNNANAHFEKPRGGSSWQGLLHAQNSNVYTTNELKNGAKDEFDMPLDLIIDKCLLQEISLQYHYVSRFCIKLLEGGFDLQEHFRSLRRYHFMEIADWADLFITTLWRNRKWYPTEADKKIPEIQGLLKSSIQSSSCDKDCNKDRLYVYVKDLSQTPISTAGAELHTFDYIGLGYRVDWPVNIVLTPNALSMYADIFTFLIQLKLAAISLSDLWCSLKNLRHLVSQNGEQNQVAKNNFSYLVKLRHQVNHFVSTLQQYVLSQLSGVSWCRFCHSLKYEVKDMMDLESVHEEYLMDSLRICFLSDEMRPVLNNLESILQCALDFRSCLINGVGTVGAANEVLLGHIAQINISQVFLIKEKFDKNIKELYLSYLKSPKHGEFGLGPFWSRLNYNNFYSNVGFDTAHHSSYR
ncbi:hypothetical protein vseg_013068 [Gypsophila vaccaria]